MPPKQNIVEQGLPPNPGPKKRITEKTKPEDAVEKDDSRTPPMCVYKRGPPREQARFQTAAMDGRSEEGQNEKKAADMPRPKMGGKEAREKAEKEAEAADEVESRGTKGSPSHPILPKANPPHTPQSKLPPTPNTMPPPKRPPTQTRIPTKNCF